jgi:hypothetical protein
MSLFGEERPLLKKIIICSIAPALIFAVLVWNTLLPSPLTRDNICLGGTVNTKEEAYGKLENYVLFYKLRELKKLGGDEETFDYVDFSPAYDQCASPPRFVRFDKYAAINPWMQISISFFVKGDCENCWDIIWASSLMTRCGTVFEFQMGRKPNYRYFPWERDKKGASQCPPLYWPPRKS